MTHSYESPEAFTRAFKNLHGVMPISACDMSVSLKAYPRITFQISMKGDIEMNYRIVQREAFEMFGVCEEINSETAFDDVPKFWGKIASEKSCEAINELLGRFFDTNIHAALYDFTETNLKYSEYEQVKVPEFEAYYPMGIEMWVPNKTAVKVCKYCRNKKMT